MPIDNTAMTNAVNQSLETELKHDLVLQRSKYGRIQPQKALIPASDPSLGNSGQIKILIQQDGDFRSERLAMSIRGPVDATGKSLRTAPGASARQTAFPSGLKNAANWDIAAGGLAVQITEAGSGLKLTDGYVDVNLIASPGYLAQVLSPLNLRYTLRKNVTLLFDFINRDDASQDTTVTNGNSALFHEVSVGLIGQKYQGVADDI